MGGAHSSWFVGVTAESTEESLKKHRIDSEKNVWIFKTADSSFEAKRIYEYFTKFIDTDGAYANNSNESINIFMYRKNR